MITNEQQEKVQGWFSGRLPKEWTTEPAKVTVDREEITVVLTIDDVAAAESEVETAEARAGRAQRVPRGDPRRADQDRAGGRAPLRAQGVVGS